MTNLDAIRARDRTALFEPHRAGWDLFQQAIRDRRDLLAMLDAEREFQRYAAASVEGSSAAIRRALPVIEAARAMLDGWNAYVEAQAGRGHEGPHVPDSALEGGCGPCAGAQYGTEAWMNEWHEPALRAALAAYDEAQR